MGARLQALQATLGGLGLLASMPKAAPSRRRAAAHNPTGPAVAICAPWKHIQAAEQAAAAPTRARRGVTAERGVGCLVELGLPAVITRPIPLPQEAAREPVEDRGEVAAESKAPLEAGKPCSSAGGEVLATTVVAVAAT
mmetsp:Transcript_16915/g.47212  ORF Transcript_16915/g.47212 Transcript_16915/m.47212 type:complete len:139 (+) Transcript_16915:230-646(+)